MSAPGERPPLPPQPPAGPQPPATEPLGRPLAPRTPLPGEPLPGEPLAPAPGPPWWRDTWATVLVGVLGLIVGGLLGALIGSSDGSSTQTVTERQQTGAQTQTVTSTITSPPKIVVHTQTVTVTSEVKTAAPSGGGEEATGETGQGRYRGSGSKTIGTIEVAKRSTLEWTSDGTRFQVITSEGSAVSSRAHSGRVVLEPGTYKQVQVSSDGNWTISIVPG